jgi:hypothetical protein
MMRCIFGNIRVYFIFRIILQLEILATSNKKDMTFRNIPENYQSILICNQNPAKEL